MGTQRHRMGVTIASCFLIRIKVHFRDSVAKKKKKQGKSLLICALKVTSVKLVLVSLFPPFQDELFSHKVIVQCFYSYTS